MNSADGSSEQESVEAERDVELLVSNARRLGAFETCKMVSRRPKIAQSGRRLIQSERSPHVMPTYGNFPKRQSSTKP